MRLKSFLKKLVFGYEVLEELDSPISGEITVGEDLFGRREMRIGGLAQSGGLAEKLWKTSIKEILNQFLNYKNFKCLILGLGCGAVAKLISGRFPMAKMVGVEIDPLVIEIGKKYFSLGGIKNLKIVVGDAFKYVEDFNNQSRTTNHQSLITNYDLIIVDLYLGQEFPKEAESEVFLAALKKILDKNGLIVFNRLYFNKSHQKLTENFLAKLEKNYLKIKAQKLFTNMLIFGEI